MAWFTLWFGFVQAMTVRRFTSAFALSIMLVLSLAGYALASDSNVRTVAQVTFPTSAPVTPNGITQVGVYLTAPVVLDGVTLFRIGAPLNAPVTQLPIGARVTLIQTALSQLIAENGEGARANPIFDSQSIRIHNRRVGDAIVLEAVDAKHPDPLPILTVTAVDARANSSDIDALAGEWQNTLQSAVVRALVLRQPAVERRSVQSVIRLAIILVAVSLIVWAILRELWRRMAQLEIQISTRLTAAESQNGVAAEDPGASRNQRRSLALRLRTLKPTQRLNVAGAIAETLLWALAVSWLSAITWSLSLFAETTPLAQTIAHSTLAVAATVVFAVLLSRILDAIIARTADAWPVRRYTNAEDRARMLLRVPTIAGAIGGAKTFLLVFVAALSVLGQVGVPIGSVVTIGGLAAIALSLAAQNFVRDFLNGFLVLLEDQYVVGDYVTINTFSGIVERLTLRMAQIRDSAGDLVTVPHSSVTSVVNQSRNWSRVDYRVPVDPNADIPKAIEIVRAQIVALGAEGDWIHGGGEAIEWIGIDSLSKDSVIIRASVRTAPLRQFELRRLINERVLAAFGAAGIGLGAPLPV